MSLPHGSRASARIRARRHRRIVRTGASTLGVFALAIGALIAVPAVAQPVPTGIFADSLQPAIEVDSDRAAVELGVEFSPKSAGAVTGLQYYQGRAAKEVTTATLWSSTGRILAQASFAASRSEGWRTVPLSRPVALTAGETYVVSYHAPHGGYPVTENDLVQKRTQNGFVLDKGAGVYKYGLSGFPQSTHMGSNYLVDIVFSSGATPTPTATPVPSTTATPAPRPTSTPTPTTTPSPTATPTPTVTPTSTPTPTPTPTVTPTPTPTPTPPPIGPGTGGTGWTVNANTVGLAPLGLSCAALPVYTGSTTVPAGTVISGMRVTTPLDLTAGNITIERSCIQPAWANRGRPIVSAEANGGIGATGKVVIRDSEFDGSLLSAESAAWTGAFTGAGDLISNYIHGFGSGIAVMNSGSTLSMTIERNYVTGLVRWGDPATTGNHSDAFTIRDFTAARTPGRELIVRNNRFDCDSGSDTGAIFIQTYAGRIDNVALQGNLLEGGGYQLGLEQTYNPYSNVRAVNNRFSNTGWGSTYRSGGPGWSEWANNFVYNSGATDGRGAAVRQP